MSAADIKTGPRYQLRRDNSGSLAKFTAIRRASSWLSNFAADKNRSKPFLI
jgi:hypothetical protein